MIQYSIMNIVPPEAEGATGQVGLVASSSTYFTRLCTSCEGSTTITITVITVTIDVTITITITSIVIVILLFNIYVKDDSRYSSQGGVQWEGGAVDGGSIM